MAKIPNVSIDLWKNLYSAALKFKDLKPWETFEDTQIFGVKDPVSAQMGYGCILGSLGEVLALCLYRGAEGFSIHQKMQKGNIKKNEMLVIQNCLMAEFTNQGFLEKADMEVIQKLGHHFRGPKAWPFFRSYLPDHLPWYLTESEVSFLTFALSCACDVAVNTKSGQININEKSNQIFCYAQKNESEIVTPIFETRWEPHPIYRPEPFPPFQVDSERITLIKTTSLKENDVWEAGSFFLPMTIMDRDRPYIPRFVLIVDRHSGFILKGEVVSPEKSLPQSLGEAILDSIENYQALPKEIHIREESVVTSLSPFAKSLGIQFKSVERLVEVSRAWKEIEKFSKRKEFPEGFPKIDEDREINDAGERLPIKIPDRRAIEGTLFEMEQALDEKEFKSKEEFEEWLEGVNKKQEFKKAPPKNALNVSQRIMYEAWDAEDPQRRIELAEKALVVSPECADAYNLLAEESAETTEEALDLYQKGMEAGEKSLGSQFIKENSGHFWGMIETRPYMRAREGVARSLWTLGKHDDAIIHYNALLKLNPNDNQGIRYSLLSCLGELGRFEEMEKLMRGGYEDDCAPEWLYTKALLTFAKEGNSSSASADLKKAWDENKHVPDYLLGRKKIPYLLPDRIQLGGEDEAYCYASSFMDTWKRVSGSLNWLQREILKLIPPKIGRNEPCFCGSGKKYKKCCENKINYS